MSEPATRADRIDRVVPGVRHWSIHDDRINFRSDAYAVDGPEGAVLIDPLPLTEAAFEELGPVAAIVLTSGHHQRSAWSFRRELGGVEVLAPRGAAGLEEEPDAVFGDGDPLPNGLRAVEAPGVGEEHFTLRWTAPDGREVLFSSDLFMRGEAGALALIPDKYSKDPQALRRSARAAAETMAETVCPAHGAPAVSGGALAMRAALAGVSGG